MKYLARGDGWIRNESKFFRMGFLSKNFQSVIYPIGSNYRSIQILIGNCTRTRYDQLFRNGF